MTKTNCVVNIILFLFPNTRIDKSGYWLTVSFDCYCGIARKKFLKKIACYPFLPGYYDNHVLLQFEVQNFKTDKYLLKWWKVWLHSIYCGDFIWQNCCTFSLLDLACIFRVSLLRLKLQISPVRFKNKNNATQ